MLTGQIARGYRVLLPEFPFGDSGLNQSLTQSVRLGIALAIALFSLPVFAQLPNDGMPVIAGGRENEILGLLQPYNQQPPLPGWSISNISIDGHVIRYDLQGPSGKQGTIVLGHPGRMAEEKERTASFAVHRDGANDAETSKAIDILVDAVRKNDKGNFWPPAPPPVRAGSDSGGGSHSEASLWERAKSFDVSTTVDISLSSLRGLLNTFVGLLGDGIFLFVVAMTFLVFHLRRVLKDEPRWYPLGLIGLVVVAGLLRLALSCEAPMNAWPYERIIPIARRTFGGVILPMLSRSPGHSYDLTEVIFKWDFLLATITPVAFFAHARYVLRDIRSAFVAAAILTVLPNHLHFSRADSEFVQSLATSSLTFVVLYTALRDTSRGWRTLCFILLPLLCSATYFVRPENMVFYFIDIGAILLTSGLGATRKRQILAFSLTSAAAVFAFMNFLLVMYSQNIHEGLDLRTLTNAASMVFSPELNTLINIRITPPGLTLLAIVGSVVLFRQGDRKRSIFLILWLSTFFVVHSYVRPTEAAMQARYHMHLITPFLMLAAGATPALLKQPRWVPITVFTYLALSPLIHMGFIRDTRFNEMDEFAFIREQRPKVPFDCTVLEFSPAVDPADPNHVFASRWGRMGTQMADGQTKNRWKVVNSGKLPQPSHSRDAYEVLTPAALELIENPPECLYVYEGLSCRSHRPASKPVAPVCDELRRRLDLEPVASTHLLSRVYDEVNAGRVYTLEDGRTIVEQTLAPGDDIPLTLYRVRGLAKREDGAQVAEAKRDRDPGNGDGSAAGEAEPQAAQPKSAVER